MSSSAFSVWHCLGDYFSIIAAKIFSLFVVSFFVLSIAFFQPSPVLAASGEATADRVIGQADMNSGLLLPASDSVFKYPSGVTVDRQHGNRLFVVDQGNSRILGFSDSTDFGSGSANLVLGQTGYSSSSAGSTATTLSGPNTAVVDSQGNLYVSDYNNHRVLKYSAPLTSSMAASVVLGQVDFTSHLPNKGGAFPDARSLYGPIGLAVDSADNLYVADTVNNRVLKYAAPVTTNQAAALVIGQPSPTALDCNAGGSSPTASTVCVPAGLAVDSVGNLYVADMYNSRVLEYDQPLSNAMPASRVFGQDNFTSRETNQGGSSPDASTLFLPSCVTLDGRDNLYICDHFYTGLQFGGNNRVLGYNAPLLTDTVADHVFGQDNFTTAMDYGVTADIFSGPLGAAVDGKGNLLVVDAHNHRVLAFDKVPVCDDGVVDSDEFCDDDNSTNGDGCSSSCQVEAGYNCTGAPSQCVSDSTPVVCGDDLIGSGEDCDGSNLNGKTCVTQGFQSGALACDSCQFDVLNCSNGAPSSNAICGDNTKDAGEVCDGSDLGGATCASVDEQFTGGSLTCKADCSGFQTDSCTSSAPSSSGGCSLVQP